MQRQCEIVVRALDGRNLDMYLSFLGGHLYATLLTHLRRFSGTVCVCVCQPSWSIMATIE